MLSTEATQKPSPPKSPPEPVLQPSPPEDFSELREVDNPFNGQNTLNEVVQFWQEHQQQIKAAIHLRRARLGEDFQQILEKLFLVLDELQSHPIPQAIYRVRQEGLDTFQEIIYLTKDKRLALATIANSDYQLVRVSGISFSTNPESQNLTLNETDPRLVRSPIDTRADEPTIIFHQGKNSLLFKLVTPRNSPQQQEGKREDSITIVTRESSLWRNKRQSEITAHLSQTDLVLDPITLSS